MYLSLMAKAMFLLTFHISASSLLFFFVFKSREYTLASGNSLRGDAISTNGSPGKKNRVLVMRVQEAAFIVYISLRFR